MDTLFQGSTRLFMRPLRREPGMAQAAARPVTAETFCDVDGGPVIFYFKPIHRPKGFEEDGMPSPLGPGDMPTPPPHPPPPAAENRPVEAAHLEEILEESEGDLSPPAAAAEQGWVEVGVPLLSIQDGLFALTAVE
eukprot:TRINITY_DN30085_c0_g2_i1.p1 TRINITY_DN30085_c0_g2~~TRINITY_DN30085_c0_g2_i1.p1  ORF type:complete len:159 (-),score=37.27 TRINITY_DN30085_c0_g2_i1:13-420(-)